MTSRNEVYGAIDGELAYQNQRVGSTLSSDRLPTADQPAGSRSVDEFALYIVGYGVKLLNSTSTFGKTEDKLDLIRKIAGLCVACMEQHGAPRRDVVGDRDDGV